MILRSHFIIRYTVSVPNQIEIRKYFNKYYVPNNMAICLSGDLDFDPKELDLDSDMGENPLLFNFLIISHFPCPDIV